MEGYDMPKRDDKRILPPTEEEFRAILQHAAPHCQRLILISYYTGLRPGLSEAFSMRWEHVDISAGTITVISAKKGGLPARIVPIHPDLMAHLKKWQKEDGDYKGYVIHYHYRKITTSMKKAWNSAVKRAGITKPIRPYSLRHKAISDMLSAGADVGTVAEIVGHSNPMMTMKIYQQTNTAMKVRAIEGLGRTNNVLPDVVDDGKKQDITE